MPAPSSSLAMHSVPENPLIISRCEDFRATGAAPPRLARRLANYLRFCPRQVQNSGSEARRPNAPTGSRARLRIEVGTDPERGTVRGEWHVLLRAPTIWTLCAGMLALAAPTYAQGPDPLATLSEVALPADIRGATAAIGDTLPPDRGQFMLEFIRRSHNLPFLGKADTRIGPIRALGVPRWRGLYSFQREHAPASLVSDFWTDVVFERRVTSGALLAPRPVPRCVVALPGAAVARRRDTSMDRCTPPADRRHLPHAAGFSWPWRRACVSVGYRPPPSRRRRRDKNQSKDSVGEPAKDVDGFIRALVTQGDGRMAYFFGAVSRLTPLQTRLAFEWIRRRPQRASTRRDTCPASSSASHLAGKSPKRAFSDRRSIRVC